MRPPRPRARIVTPYDTSRLSPFTAAQTGAIKAAGALAHTANRKLNVASVKNVLDANGAAVASNDVRAHDVTSSCGM